MPEYLTPALCAAVLVLMIVQIILLTRRRRDTAAEELAARIETLRTELLTEQRAAREGSTAAQRELNAATLAAVSELNRLQQASSDVLLRTQQASADALNRTLETRLSGNEERIERMRTTMDKHLLALQMDNADKLDKMRHAIDVRLQDTLEKRLSESFRSVSERLEQVHKGLGEMQALASGVGDLQRLFSGVKNRGIWGEVALGTLLEEMLAPEQFAQNVAIAPRSQERVEFAIRLPGDGSTPIWLPIDSKFPTASYQLLLSAQDTGDKPAAELAGKALEDDIKVQARRIRDKYIIPPHSTNFAVLFLPTEGLYAEVLRRPGLLEWSQRECRVTIAGPTTLAALLNSLQLGFRTLAIQKRSNEVWKLLASVKKSFDLFAQDIGRAQNQVSTLATTLGKVSDRSASILGRLGRVELLPADEEAALPPAFEPPEAPETLPDDDAF